MNSTITNTRVGRILGISLALIALVAGALWVSGVAHAASPEPVISSVATSATGTAATVTWSTDEAANSQIAYGTSLPYTATTTLDSAMVTNHQETISDLTPDTTYHYEVLSTDGSGNTNYSGDNTFSTGAATTTLSLSTTSGVSGTGVTINGSGFQPAETITLVWSTASTTVVADSNGDFSTMWTAPSVSSGDVVITATGTSGGSASTTFDVTTNSTPTIPTLSLNTQSGAAGSALVVSGTGFSPNEQVDVAFGTSTMSTTADTNGDFSTTISVPSVGTGTYDVIATGATSNDVASNTFAVTAATTSAPVISDVLVTPTDEGATITWTTDQAASSQVYWGSDTNYSYATNIDDTLTTSHTATLEGLTPGTTYHFEVMSGASSSGDMTFTTTDTGGSTDVTTLQSEVSQLQTEVANLQSQVAALMNNQGAQTSAGPASIDQNGETVGAGSTIDFGGHNFMHDENVTVTMDGQTVATAYADGGGNFSTGSLTVPSTPGTYSYTFAGSNGDSATATVTVQ